MSEKMEEIWSTIIGLELNDGETNELKDGAIIPQPSDSNVAMFVLGTDGRTTTAVVIGTRHNLINWFSKSMGGSQIPQNVLDQMQRCIAPARSGGLH